MTSEIKFPKNPDDLLEQGWEDVTDLRMRENTENREYTNPETGERVRFDKGREGARGYEGQDHYHIYNPNSKNRGDMYLDKYGNPVRKGAVSSHILP